MDRPKASKTRQRLREVEQARAAHIENLVKAGAMVEGSFVTLGRKCGKPGCRCETGEKHYSQYLSRSVNGRTELVYVRRLDEVDVSEKAERYRRFRNARAELMKLAAQTAELADDLQAALTEPYPEEPRPGRKAKGPRAKRRKNRKR